MKFNVILTAKPEHWPEAPYKVGFWIPEEIFDKMMQACIDGKCPVIALDSLDCSRY